MSVLGAILGGLGTAAVGGLAGYAGSYIRDKYNSSVAGTEAPAAETPESDSVGWLKGLLSTSGQENQLNRDFNSAEAQKSREWSSQEAQLQRDFEERMSNSAYQRAVADLKAAGLNPILAVQNSAASTPSVSLPNASSASYQVGTNNNLSTLIAAVASLVGQGVNLGALINKIK